MIGSCLRSAKPVGLLEENVHPREQVSSRCTGGFFLSMALGDASKHAFWIPVTL